MDYLTVAEAAQLLRVHPITVRRHIASGRLPAVYVGRRVRVLRSAVETFFQPVPPQPPQEQGHGRALTEADPLWDLVGMATGAARTDAAHKHEYLAGDVGTPTA